MFQCIIVCFVYSTRDLEIVCVRRAMVAPPVKSVHLVTMDTHTVSHVPVTVQVLSIPSSAVVPVCAR
jgi:hypothetical protein